MTEKFYALIHNAEKGETTIRELTTEEIEQLPTHALPTQEETPTDEAPASDDAGAPSTDAG